MIEASEATLTFKGDGALEGSFPVKGDEFRALAYEHWDPYSYLAWRVSTNSRHSSITHALPCSSYVDTYTQTGSFGDCSSNEVQQYYELLGKYDQFVPGWSDVKDENGNPVQPTQVDSVENFVSGLRLDYEKLRDVQGRVIEVTGTWSVVGEQLVLTVENGEVTVVSRYEYSIRNSVLTLVEEKNASVERYERRD